MTYEEALNTSEQVGAAKVEGLPLLAMTIATLALVHAVNPQLVFEVAVRKRMTAEEIRMLDPVSLGDLMFV